MFQKHSDWHLINHLIAASTPVESTGGGAVIKLIVLSVEDCFIIFMFDHVMNYLTFDNTSFDCSDSCCEHVITYQIYAANSFESASLGIIQTNI